MLTSGTASLSNAELMAILPCTGSQELLVLDLCREMLLSVDNDLKRFQPLSANELCRFSGIGPANAATFLAAFELGRRRR